MKTTVARDGWTVTASTEELAPRIRVEHEDWEPNQPYCMGCTTVARQMATIRRAADEGCGHGTGSSRYSIPGEDLPTVLEMLDEVIPAWLRATSAENWSKVRLMPRWQSETVFLFDHYGIPHDNLRGRDAFDTDEDF